MNKANRPCSEPGCPRYAEPGTAACSIHKAPRGPKMGHSAAIHRMYCTRAWTDGRKAFLTLHPLCVECEAEGELVAATVVDHVIPHRGDPRLFYDQSNWQALCKRHHDRKTATEDGGFGNRKALPAP